MEILLENYNVQSNKLNKKIVLITDLHYKHTEREFKYKNNRLRKKY
ncbi:MAG TPA: hypothetical protein PLC53_02500 [Bacilli bacterium]|nr:hypothetical protein [Bacilli bacterium]